VNQPNLYQCVTVTNDRADCAAEKKWTKESRPKAVCTQTKTAELEKFDGVPKWHYH